MPFRRQLAHHLVLATARIRYSFLLLAGHNGPTRAGVPLSVHRLRQGGILGRVREEHLVSAPKAGRRTLPDTAPPAERAKLPKAALLCFSRRQFLAMPPSDFAEAPKYRSGSFFIQTFCRSCLARGRVINRCAAYRRPELWCRQLMLEVVKYQ